MVVVKKCNAARADPGELGLWDPAGGGVGGSASATWVNLGGGGINPFNSPAPGVRGEEPHTWGLRRGGSWDS